MHPDRALLEAFRSITGKSARVDAAVLFAATRLFFLLLLVALASVLFFPVHEGSGRLHTLGVVLAALALAEAISWTTSLVWHRERPFLHLGFSPLFWMPPRWKSFPSDHTTIGCTIAWTMLLLKHPIAPVLIIMAIGVSFARIAAGVHYPSDVFAGALLALAAASCVVFLSRTLLI